MAALIRQANSGYELANKPKIKKKDIWWKGREKTKQQQKNKQTVSEKKEEASNVSEQRVKGWYTQSVYTIQPT